MSKRQHEQGCPAGQRLREARALRSKALTPADLVEVETILRGILADLTPGIRDTAVDDTEHGREQETNEEEDRAVWTDAGTFLATLLLQRRDATGGGAEIASLLTERDFAYRLSRACLRHDHDKPSIPPARYAAAWDDVLPEHLLKRLDHTFQLGSTFWSEHDYSDGSEGRNPSPYFSYVVPLASDHEDDGPGESREMTALDAVLRILHRHASDAFPEVIGCKYAEWWAHSRPHSSGHQLHFDSDDEGRGGVRNPCASTVVNLSGKYGGGGETLVTTQTSTGRALASRGWLCSNARNRLLAFRGDLLHGVVPGPEIAACDGDMLGEGKAQDRRRVTFMVAFWDNISIQDAPGHGSARPFSRVAGEPWATALSEVLSVDGSDIRKKEKVGKNCFFEVPAWEDVDAGRNKEYGASLREVKKYKLLPCYDSFFQFFS